MGVFRFWAKINSSIQNPGDEARSRPGFLMAATARILTSTGRDLNGAILTAGDEIELSILIQSIPTTLAGSSVQLVLRYWDGDFLALLSTGLGTIVKTVETTTTISAICKIPGSNTSFIEDDSRLKFYLQLTTQEGVVVGTVLSGEFGLIGTPDGGVVMLVPAMPTPATPVLGDATRLEIPFAYGDAQPKLIGLPVKGWVSVASILISTPFNGDTPSRLKLGSASDYNELIPEFAPSEAATYEFYPTKKYETPTQIYLSIALGQGVTQGSGVVIVDYADV